MHVRHALQLFQLPQVPGNVDELRKQYLKLALQCHPDKNQHNADAAKQQFQLLQEAHEVLQREVAADCAFARTTTSWLDMVQAFVHQHQGAWAHVVEQLVQLGKHASQTLLDQVDHDSVLALYDFLSKHRAALHLSQETFAFLQDILRTRFEGLQIFHLNPSLEDLRQHKLYKLRLEDTTYLVPLWSPESYFSSSVMVICEPELPEHMWLDDDRNLCMRVEITWQTLGEHLFANNNNDNNNSPIVVGEVYEPVTVRPDQLRLTTEPQLLHFPGGGFTRFQADCLQDISQRDDLFLFVRLVP